MRQHLLQEVMQQYLSRRKGDIYRYHSETRQQITIHLLWHLSHISRAAENMFGELRKVSFVLEITPLLQLTCIQLLHLILIQHPPKQKTCKHIYSYACYLHLSSNQCPVPV